MSSSNLNVSSSGNLGLSGSAANGSSETDKDEKAKNLFPHTLQEAFQEIDQKSGPVFLGLGVDWCSSSKKFFKNLHAFAKTKQDLKIFYVDEEKSREFCKKNDIVVGTPCLMIYYQGEAMVFARGQWEPINKLKGLFNIPQLEQIHQATLEAVKLKSREITLPF